LPKQLVIAHACSLQQQTRPPHLLQSFQTEPWSLIARLALNPVSWQYPAER
jgi:hypothetical protein